MKPYYQDNHIKFWCGDFRENDLPDECVQMVCTSPPYWGLRKYSGEQDLIWGDKDCEHRWGISHKPFHSGQVNQTIAGKSTGVAEGGTAITNTCSLCGAWKGAYGLEPTPEMYIGHTIEILREIRRVLRKDGVVFWNIGDSYSATRWSNTPSTSFNPPAADIVLEKHTNLPPKNLCLIPFKVAIAAQEDGWWVRSVIIWSKPNPMPESVTDRPTESHEYILMLTKSSKYYWDADAVREPHEYIDNRTKKGLSRIHYNGVGNPEERDWSGDANWLGQNPSGRNIRTVWEFPTQPYPEAHFAVFPEKLPEICIKAATPEVGCCSKCGAPWERVIEKGLTAHDGVTHGKSDPNDKSNKGAYGRLAQLRQAARERGGEYINTQKTLGWQPTCKCNADKVPSVVLDPFMGAGTTLWVAKTLNRRAVGYEISEEYCQLALERNRQMVMEL